MRLVEGRATPHIGGMHPRLISAPFALALSLAGCSSSTHSVDAPALPARLALDGAAFYPESLTATGDGRLLVGSFGAGEVAAFAPGATTPATFIAASPAVARVLGVLADEHAHVLWLCADDTATQSPAPPQLRRYDLATGAFQAAYDFPAPAFCNDLALDGHHDLYVTDSLGALYRLADGADHLELWSHDPLLAASVAGGFGANGVAVDGATVYVTSFNDNRLLRIAIQADGSAAPATELAVTPALVGPDAVRVQGAGTLLVVEQTAGRLTRVTVGDGHATTLAAGLDQPTSVAVRDGTAWVTQGQLGHILGTVAGPPALPFVVTPVTL